MYCTVESAYSAAEDIRENIHQEEEEQEEEEKVYLIIYIPSLYIHYRYMRRILPVRIREPLLRRNNQLMNRYTPYHNDTVIYCTVCIVGMEKWYIINIT